MPVIIIKLQATHISHADVSMFACQISLSHVNCPKGRRGLGADFEEDRGKKGQMCPEGDSPLNGPVSVGRIITSPSFFVVRNGK